MRYDCTLTIESFDRETGNTLINEFAFPCVAEDGAALQNTLEGFEHRAIYEGLMFPEGKPAHILTKLKTINLVPSRYQ